MVVAPELLPSLNAQQLRELASDLIAQIALQSQQITQRDQAIASKDREIVYSHSCVRAPAIAAYVRQRQAL